ncbi:MAG: PQQ-binding-like beta-propeller repeat protein [Polyangiales bacterium]
MNRRSAALGLAFIASISLRDRGLRVPTASAQPAPAPRAPAPPRRAMFGGDARHTGRSALRGPREAPSILWRARTTRRIFASPVVDARGRAAVGSLDGAMLMVDADGVTRAAVRLPTRIFSSPAAVGPLVVFGHDARAFIALDERGATTWTIPTAQDADAPPAVGDDGTLYLASDALVAASASGEVRWRRELGGHAFGAPAVAGDAVVCTDLNGGITWVARRDGAPRAASRPGADLRRRAGAGRRRRGGRDRRGAPPRLRPRRHPPLGPRHRRRRARRRRPEHARAATRRGDRVFGAEEADLRRAPTTGRGSSSSPRYPCAAARVDRDDVAYVGGEDDAVHAVGVDGAERWRVSLGADVDSSPTLLADGVLVVGCDDGALYALGARPAR